MPVAAEETALRLAHRAGHRATMVAASATTSRLRAIGGLSVCLLLDRLATRLGQKSFQLRDPGSGLGQFARLLVESALQVGGSLLGSLRAHLIL